MTDVAGGKGKERLRKTTPERRRAEPAAPSHPAASSQPVCFTMVTRQGSQCSQLMCFSAASASWVLMCLSLSPAQSMSTVLGCTNTHEAQSQGAPRRAGWVSGREPQSRPRGSDAGRFPRRHIGDVVDGGKRGGNVCQETQKL